MKDFNRQLTFKYSLVQATYWISQCVIGGFTVVYLNSKNFSNTQIGMLLSTASAFSIILQLFISAFADKTKKVSLRQIVIAMMFVVLSMAFVLCMASHSFWLIAICYLLIISIQTALVPLFNSLAVEYINRNISINYGLARGMGSISFAATSFLLGISITHFGANIISFVFVACYCFVIVAVFSFKLKDSKHDTDNFISNDMQNMNGNKGNNRKNYEEPVNRTNHKISENSKNHNPIGKNQEKPANSSTGMFTFFIKYKKYSFQLIGISLLFYSHNIIYTYLPKIMEHVGGNETQMGISLAITAAVELPTMVAFSHIVKKIKAGTLVKIAAFFFLAKVGSIWLANNVFAVHLTQTLQMFSFALFTPASVFYVNSIIDEQDKVKGQAMLGATYSVAGIASNIIGGKLLDNYGVSVMLMIGTIVTALGFIVVCLSTEKGTQRSSP